MYSGTTTLERDNISFAAAYCIMRINSGRLAEDVALLHPDERQYYESLRADVRKQSYLSGRVAAKTAVAELTGEQDLSSIAIDHGVFEFPVVKNQTQRNIQVSLTHCGEIAVALAFPEEHPMSVDVEQIDEDRTEAIVSQMTVRELNLLPGAGMTASSGHTMLWTIKEALSKILRTGLTTDLKLLEIDSLVRSEEVLTGHYKHFMQYKAISQVAGNYACSIVLPEKTKPSLQEFWNSFRETVSAIS